MPETRHEDDALTNGPPGPDTSFDPNDFASSEADTRSTASPSNSGPSAQELADLRLDEDTTDGLGTDEVLTTVRIGKPSRESFVRTHPDRKSLYWFRTHVLDLRDDREMWLVAKDLQSQLRDEPAFQVRLLVASITMRGEVFFWPLRLPGPDGRLDDWGQSALAAAEAAMKRWLRVYSVPGVTGYRVQAAKGNLPEPRWPDLSPLDLLNIAFKGRYITDPGHAILKRLRGES
jgi:hypothetical protein